MSNATLAAISSYRNRDHTPVTPGMFTPQARATRAAARSATTTVERPAPVRTVPVTTPAATSTATQLVVFAARMRAGEFSIAVADGLAALLDIPQNTKKTGESVMLYALRRATPSGSGNDITYFEVKTFNSRNGKARRIQQLIGAPGAWRRERLTLRLQALALFHILEDQAGAQRLFADTTQTCCRCGSPLTNKASRDRGYGPDCASKI
jgi:hypothetical protein